jgi:hypothetical protein
MKKISIITTVILLLSLSLVSAHEHNAEEVKQMIDSGISCDKLTDEQLEAIGEYYMEQMHPGEAHKLMDEMMGGEGSDSLKQMHIRMAKRLYCNEDVGGMMGGNTMGSGGMMGFGGMMNMMGGNMYGSGMMGNLGYSGYWNFINILYIVLLVGLIILVYLWIIRLWRDAYRKKNRK